MIGTALTFAGNLSSDPEVRFTPSGKAVAEFRVIINRRTKSEAGEWTDAEPTGYSCKLWGFPAENLANSVTRGDRVLIHGHVETETWTDRDTGEKRTRDVVNVDEVGVSLAWSAPSPRAAARRPTARSEQVT